MLERWTPFSRGGESIATAPIDSPQGLLKSVGSESTALTPARGGQDGR